MPVSDRADPSNTSLDVWVLRRALVKLPDEASDIDIYAIRDPIEILNNFHKITDEQGEHQAFAAYQMVHERYYTDTRQATEKFQAFRQTMQEARGIRERAKTPIAIGITESADLDAAEKGGVLNINRERSCVPSGTD